MNSCDIISKQFNILSEFNVTEIEIKSITNYCDRLINNDVPILFDVQDLCSLLNIEYKILSRYLYRNNDILYSKFKIKKRRNGYRVILSPCRELYLIQKKILTNILSKIKSHECSQAFCKGNSIVQNAKVHLHSELVINYDLQDFFTNIKLNQVRDVFTDIGYTNVLAKTLAKICCYKGFLPQGAPTSPIISNLVAKKLDNELQNLAILNKAKYTRYADDLTFSGNKKIMSIRNEIENIIKKNGFVVNEKKTYIRFASQGMEVTGIRISNGNMSVNKKFLKGLRKEIYFCKKYGASDHLKHLNVDKSFFKEHMYGKAYFVNMVNNALGKKLLKDLDEIVWER